MEKVTTINLAGNAYSLEEGGFVKLTAYLAEARKKLAGNPDVEDILKDFEEAFAQKCRALLNPHKVVITTAEVDQMIDEMGAVETNRGDERKSEEKAAPRRLYRVMEGSMILGVCNGIAAYFDVDVTLVRAITVILSILTSGAFIAAYFILSLILPVAGTPQEQAAAYGTLPITAQTLVDRAREGYENFKKTQQWEDHKLHRDWKRYQRRWEAETRANQYNYQYTYSPFWSFMHSLLGMAWTALIIAGLWYAYHHSMVAKEYLDAVGMLLQHLLDKVVAHFQH